MKSAEASDVIDFLGPRQQVEPVFRDLATSRAARSSRSVQRALLGQRFDVTSELRVGRRQVRHRDAEAGDLSSDCRSRGCRRLPLF